MQIIVSIWIVVAVFCVLLLAKNNRTFKMRTIILDAIYRRYVRLTRLGAFEELTSDPYSAMESYD